MALDLGIFLEGSQSTFKVKVSKNDAQAQFLLDKLTSSDGSVTITETNDGGIETIDLVAGGGSPLTTKGDLFTYSTTDARLPIGTDGQALLADSAESTGLKWGTVSADNMATADLTLTGNREHDLSNYTFKLKNSLKANVDFSLSPSGDFNWSGQAAGNEFVLNTSSSKRLIITGGHPSGFLKIWSDSSAFSIMHFYSLTLKANNGSNAALRIQFNGATSFAKDVYIGTSIGTFPTAKLDVQGAGSTSASTDFKVRNSSGTEAMSVRGDSVIIMANLPTSSAGLPTGALWNNSGVLNIV